MVETIFDEWEKALNEDGEIERRLEPFSTFIGGPTPKVGPGPYEPANVAIDPSNWAEAEGYKRPKIKEFGQIVEITVSGEGTYTIEYVDGEWNIREGASEGEAVLEVEMPLEVFKDMLTTRERVVWSLSDPQNEISYKDGVALSDWTTVFEIFACAQEMLERKPDLWERVEDL